MSGKPISHSYVPGWRRSVLILVGTCAAVLPLVLGGLWLMASQVNQLGEDAQRRAMFGLFLPFIAGSVALPILVHRRMFGRAYSTSAALTGSLFAILLSWLAVPFALTMHGLAPWQLPMLDRQTPAPITWWVIGVTAWLLLMTASGALYIAAARASAGAPSGIPSPPSSATRQAEKC